MQECRALSKGLQILEHLNGPAGPSGLTALARLTGLGKASALRLLETLVSAGYLLQRDDNRYQLNRVWTAMPMPHWLDQLLKVAQPEMKTLHEEFAETVSLAVLAGDHIRVVATLEGTRTLRISMSNNRIVPPDKSSLGLAICAHQTPERQRELLQVYGSHSADPAAIRRSFEGVRMLGTASEFREAVQGGCSFAAPIFSDGVVNAAINIAAPVDRMTAFYESEMTVMLLAAARRISIAISKPE